MALSPPPTTATVSPRKKEPSQVAQAHALSDEALLVFEAEVLGRGARRDDDRLGVNRRLPVHQQAVGALPQVHVRNRPVPRLGAEALGLILESVHHLRPEDPFRKAGIVLHVGRGGELAAGLRPHEDEGRQVGAGGVEGGGPPGRARADDHDVPHLRVRKVDALEGREVGVLAVGGGSVLVHGLCRGSSCKLRVVNGASAE